MIIFPGVTSSSHSTGATALSDNAAVFSVVVTNVVSSATSSGATLSVNAAPAAYVPPGLLAQPAPSPEIYAGGVMDGQFTSEDFSGKYSDNTPYYRNVLAIPHYGAWVANETEPREIRYGYNGDHAIVRNCEM